MQPPIRPGILFEKDWEVLAGELAYITSRFRDELLTLCEIGTCHGDTTLAVLEQLWLLGVPQHRVGYYAIDPNPNKVDHPCVITFHRLSHQVADKIGLLNWLLIDGCHCVNCVERDVNLYAPHLVSGGVLLLHDASPNTQAPVGPQDYEFLRDQHNVAEAMEGIGVRKAIGRIDWKKLGLELKKEALPQPLGGVEVWTKL